MYAIDQKLTSNLDEAARFNTNAQARRVSQAMFPDRPSLIGPETVGTKGVTVVWIEGKDGAPGGYIATREIRERNAAIVQLVDKAFPL